MGHSKVRFVVLNSIGDEVLEVKDVAHLAGDCYAHAVACSDPAIVLDCFVRCFCKLTVDQVAANHQAGPALTGFAVDCRNALWTSLDKLRNVFAEG